MSNNDGKHTKNILERAFFHEIVTSMSNIFKKYVTSKVTPNVTPLSLINTVFINKGNFKTLFGIESIKQRVRRYVYRLIRLTRICLYACVRKLLSEV